MAESAGTYTIQIVGLSDGAVQSLDRVDQKVRTTTVAIDKSKDSAFGLKQAVTSIAVPLGIVAAFERITASIVESVSASGELQKSLDETFNTFASRVSKITQDQSKATEERIAGIRAESFAALGAIDKERDAIRDKWQEGTGIAGAYRQVLNEIFGVSKKLNDLASKDTEFIKEKERADIARVQRQGEEAKAAEKRAAAQKKIDDETEARHAEEVAQEASDDAEWVARTRKNMDFEEFVAKDMQQKRLERERDITREHERQLQILKEQSSTLAGMNFTGLGRGASVSVGQARRHLQGRR